MKETTDGEMMSRYNMGNQGITFEELNEFFGISKQQVIEAIGKSETVAGKGEPQFTLTYRQVYSLFGIEFEDTLNKFLNRAGMEPVGKK